MTTVLTTRSPVICPDLTKAVASRLEPRLVTTEAGLRALQPHWDSLLEQSATRTPFMTWDWISLWWEQHRGSCQLCTAVIDDPITGRPLAIAPLMIGRPRQGFRRSLRHLSFIGGIGEDASQGMDFLVPEGLEEKLTPRLCRVFHRAVLRWDAIDLPAVHAESPNLPHFRTALSRFAQSGERTPPQESLLMSLPGTWDEPMKTWKAKRRAMFRASWRKVMDEHQGRTLQGGIDLPAGAAFDELWRLHSLRFEGRHSMFLNPRMRALHQSLVQRWAPSGRAMLPVIEAQGQIVAARYGFAFDGKFWSYQTGFDPSFSKYSVGTLSLGWAAQCAVQRGLTEIDHMPGDARYKTEWSTHRRIVHNLEAFNRLSLTATFFRLLRAFSRNRNPATAAPSSEDAE